MENHRNVSAVMRKYRERKNKHHKKCKKEKQRKRKIEKREHKNFHPAKISLVEEDKDFFGVEISEECPKYHEEKWKLEDLMKREDFRGFYNISEKTREEFEKTWAEGGIP